MSPSVLLGLTKKNKTFGYDCVKGCNAWSAQVNQKPVYSTDVGSIQVCTNGEPIVYAVWSAKGYRIPTEAEW